MAFAPPALTSCPHINLRGKRYWHCPVCNASSAGWNRWLRYIYCLTPKAVREILLIAHSPVPCVLSPVHLCRPIAVGSVRLRSDGTRLIDLFLPISSWRLPPRELHRWSLQSEGQASFLRSVCPPTMQLSPLVMPCTRRTEVAIYQCLVHYYFNYCIQRIVYPRGRRTMPTKKLTFNR